MRPARIEETPSTSTAVIEKTVTKTVEHPALPLAISGAAPNAEESHKKPHVNVWFASLPPDERANRYGYTLYRDDPNVIIVEENFDNRSSGAFLHKFKPEEIVGLPEGPFIQELAEWIKPRYGGGKFHLMIYQKKDSRLMYNTGIKIEGPPLLSPREGWAGGVPPASGPDQQAFAMLINLFDKKLAEAKDNRTEPSSALTQAIEAVSRIQSEGFKTFMDQMPKAQDPIQRLTELRAMVELFATLQGNREPAVARDPMLEMRQMLELMKLLRENEAPKQDIGQIVKDAVSAVAEKLIPARANRGGGISDGFLEAVKVIAPNIGPFFAPIGVAIAEKIRRAPVPGQPGVMAGPSLVPRPAQLVGARPATPGAVTLPTAPAGPIVNPQNGGSPVSNQEPSPSRESRFRVPMFSRLRCSPRRTGTRRRRDSWTCSRTTCRETKWPPRFPMSIRT